MRRLIIFFFWFFRSRNNVSFGELLRFGFKPRVNQIADRFIKSVVPGSEFFRIEFNNLASPLYWPALYPVEGIYQVTAETFDTEDWHYYQKTPTPVTPEDVLVDVGAAEGLFALSVANRSRKIFLIEPNRQFIGALERTFQHLQERVTIVNAAVGSTEGTISIDDNSLASKVGEQTGTVVPLKSIDSLFPSTRITYLKADVEGFELELLKGARETISRDKPKIAITSYHTENNADEMIALVKSYVPEYQVFKKGIFHHGGKPVMIHFWI